MKTDELKLNIAKYYQIGLDDQTSKLNLPNIQFVNNLSNVTNPLTGDIAILPNLTTYIFNNNQWIKTN